MPSVAHITSPSNINSWVSGSTWRERIITFDPSWFTLTMGTGVIVQLLNYFPWPAYWLRNLGYVFWLLDVVVFAFFTIMGGLRLVVYPSIALSILEDFSQTAYLGAVPISLDTVATGIILYYNSNDRAIHTAEALYWVSVTMTAAVGLGGVFVMYRRQGQHKLQDVTGVWLLAFIPMIVTAALGSALCQHLNGKNTGTVLVVSFLMLSLGLGMSLIVITIYFWRLMACNLPARDAIVSCFVPVGPLSMGAFTVLGLSLGLSRYVTVEGFVFEETWNLSTSIDVQAAIGQTIIWIGVIAALMLLGMATFFLVEAFASVSAKVPKQFNIGLWSSVFPCGVYANAFCRLSTTLRNSGMKGWAAVWVVVTVLLWLTCAIMTVYKGVWQGKLFIAPGLQGYTERQKLDEIHESHDVATPSGDSRPDLQATMQRQILPDGTYRRFQAPAKVARHGDV